MMLKEEKVATLYGYGLAALAASLPFYTKISSTISILILLLWVYEGNWHYKWQAFKKSSWLQLFIGFYFLHAIGLLYTQNLTAGVFDLEKKLSLLLFPLIIGTSSFLKKNVHLRDKVHSWFILSCFAALVYCLGQGVYRFLEGIPPTLSVYGGFEATQQFKNANEGASGIWDYITYSELLTPLRLHPTYAAMYLLLAVCILLEQALKYSFRHDKRKIALYFFFFAFLSISIFLLASRIAIVLYIVLLPLLLLKHVWHRLSWYSIVAGCATVVIIFFAIVNYVPIVKHRFANDINLAGKAYESDNPGTGMMMRLVFWRTAIEVIEQNPILGVGTGDSQNAMDIHYEEKNLNSLLGYNPHSQYLHTGVMLGLIGTLYLLVTLLLPLIVAFRRNDTIYKIFLLVISVSFLTESVLQGNKGIVFYALFNALYFFYYSPYEATVMKKRS